MRCLTPRGRHGRVGRVPCMVWLPTRACRMLLRLDCRRAARKLPSPSSKLEYLMDAAAAAVAAASSSSVLLELASMLRDTSPLYQWYCRHDGGRSMQLWVALGVSE